MKPNFMITGSKLIDRHLEKKYIEVNPDLQTRQPTERKLISQYEKITIEIELIGQGKTEKIPDINILNTIMKLLDTIYENRTTIIRFKKRC